MYSKEELKSLLEHCIQDFNSQLATFLRNPRMAYTFGFSEYPVKLEKGGHNIYRGVTINRSLLIQTVGQHTYEFESSKKLFEFLKDNDLIIETHKHLPLEKYEDVRNISPSIISQILGGFIARSFELNDNNPEITAYSFNKSFEELSSYFDKDYIVIQSVAPIKGLSGEIEDIKLQNGVKIFKADMILSKTINLAFNKTSTTRFTEFVMYPGDYVLEVIFQIPKSSYLRDQSPGNRYMELCNSALHKWENLPFLAFGGNLKIGPTLFNTADWAMANHGAFKWSADGELHSAPKFKALVSPNNLDKIHEIASIFSLIDFNMINEKIKYAITRLKKSKSAGNLDDRIIELALALEFIVPSSSTTEVLLRLQLSIIKLLEVPDDQTENICKTIKSFYSLRSVIIHGNNSVPDSEVNVIVIKATEEIIQKLILTMLTLSLKYDYKLIKDTLDSMIFNSSSFTDVIQENLIKLETQQKVLKPTFRVRNQRLK